MNGKLVDTNVIIRFFKGQTELFNLFDDVGNIYVSSVTVGELLYGAELSSKKDFNSQTYKGFCEQLNIINIDLNIADRYASIKADLKSKGKPIPENDIWIAATAIENELTLITADSDFDYVSNLQVEKK